MKENGIFIERPLFIKSFQTLEALFNCKCLTKIIEPNFLIKSDMKSNKTILALKEFSDLYEP